MRKLLLFVRFLGMVKGIIHILDHLVYELRRALTHHRKLLDGSSILLLRMTDIESVHAATLPHHLMLQVLIQGLAFGDKLNIKMHRLYKT